MRRDDFFPVWRGRAVPLLLVLGCAPWLSCFAPESVICRSGKVCGPGLACAAIQDTCIDTPCGDGIIQDGETCDDGNILDGDGCSRDCRSSEGCGNGKIDLEVGEVCDDNNTIPGDGCSADCKSNELCGNGIIDTSVGEVCDDKNTAPADNCSADCKSDERCGNGIVDSAVGEVCDDGDSDEGELDDGDGCSSDCRSGEGCGNGVRDLEEDCDDGNDKNDDDCLNTCLKASCGDGFRDRAFPGVEACDDGGESAACDRDCTVRVCGDGVVNTSAGEQCDNPGPVSDSRCDADCSLSACGDGFLNLPAGESCDDNNASNSDDCLTTCQPNVCGDGQVDLQGPDVEACDDGNQESEQTCPYGTPACTACRSDCKAILTLTGPFCGDGAIAQGEACDDRNAEACGTCNSACTQFQRSKATGRIKAVPGNLLNTGSRAETFSLNDGINNVPVTFEFDKNGEVVVGHIPVRISNSDSREDVATAIRNAIEGIGPELQIKAEVAGDEVLLTHEFDGAYGNQPIIDSVRDSGFRVSGMAEGKGYDCPTGTPCMSAQDCEPALTCLPQGVCGEPAP